MIKDRTEFIDDDDDVRDEDYGDYDNTYDCKDNDVFYLDDDCR
jgi:hypothetical protein